MIQQTKDFYSKNISDLSAQLKRVSRINRQFYAVRLFVFCLIVTFFILFLKYDYSYLYLIFTGASFVMFLISLKVNYKSMFKEQYLIHEKSLNELEVDFLEYKFQNRESGEKYKSLNPHLADDFDLFGQGSLFQYINRCSTQLGKERLAKGLTHSELGVEVILNRQKAIKELSEKMDFVQQFQTNGRFLDEKGDEVVNIIHWLNEKENNDSLLKLSTLFFPILMLGCVVLIVMGIMAIGTLVFPIMINLLVIKFFNKQIKNAHEKLGKTADSFQKYTTLLKLIEKESFTSPYLLSLKDELMVDNIKASRSLTRLFRLLNNLDVRYNVFVSILLNSFMVFDIQVLFRLNKWKRSNKSAVSSWFDALSKMDELTSYSVFAFNNKGLVIYPEVSKDSFVFDATELGHPLINPVSRISNTLKFIGKPNVLIVTGANMAGKSTFLRTLSVNLILAMNGAPVCAKMFRFTPCDIMSSIKIQDSLSNQESYFYAELLRLKEVIEHVKTHPQTFVILDEILRGTNTKDKQLGSIGLLKKMINENAITIIATHDLEIGKLESEYPEIVTNYCFEVELQNDQLIFDYKLKSGISSKLNASFLMKKMEIMD